MQWDADLLKKPKLTTGLTPFQCKKYLLEAKHSLAIVLGFCGEKNIGIFMLKWPDVVDAILDGNIDDFKKDMHHLICRPLIIIADSLSDLTKEKYKIDFKNEVLNACYGTDPFITKNNLIKVCNKMIDKLCEHGEKYEYIQELKQ